MKSVRFGCLIWGAVTVAVSCRDFSQHGGAEVGGRSGYAGGAGRSVGEGGAPEELGAGGPPAAGALAGGAAENDMASGGGLAQFGGAPAEAGGPMALGGADSETRGGGAGGAEASGGEASVFGGNEPTLLPGCEFVYSVVPDVISGFAISATSGDSTNIQLYEWDLGTNSALVRWRDPSEPRTGWTQWLCFDLVPGVRNMAAMNLSNGKPEVFALADQFLYVRREAATVWTPWLPFSLPERSSRVGDLGAAGGSRPRVYIVDRGRVFVRSKVSEEVYADYGPWVGLADNGAVLVAAAQQSGAGQMVATIDASGLVETAVEDSPEQGFSVWTELSRIAAPIVDLAAFGAGGNAAVYALDATGVVWKNAEWSVGTAWVALTSTPTVRVVSIATAASGDVYGTDVHGGIYRVDLQNGEWDLVVDPIGG